jgi:hypothetical protein
MSCVLAKIQHTVNYDVNRGIKNTSQWRKILDSLTESNVSEIADIFMRQLVEDAKNLQENREVTECAVVCPSRRSTYDKKYKFGEIIAYKLFPLTEDDQKKTETVKKTWVSVQYQQLLSKLREAYRTQLKNHLEEKEQFKIVRLSGYRSNFCTLKKKPISTKITAPEPMPVEIAPLSDLEPFFDHVKQNTMCEPTDKKDYIQFKRGAYYTDGRIDMCKQVVGEPWINLLTGSIKSNPHIEHFLLGNNIVDYVGAKAIAQFIKEQPDNKCHIKTWYIAGNRIDTKGIEMIADALATDQYAEALWLKRNPLMPEGIRYIGRMLETNKKLQILDLHNTAVLDKGCADLFESLKKNRTLEILYLDANGITIDGARCIADYFDHLVKNNLVGLKTLYLDMNRLDDEGVELLMGSLKNYPHLERLNLGSNRITEVGAKSIFETLSDRENLIMLDLGLYKSTSDMKEIPNNMNDLSVPYIVRFLKENKSVKYFSIIHNNISAEGLEQIAEAFEENHQILQFPYEQYGLEIPMKTRQKFRATMDRNIKNTYDMSIEQFTKSMSRVLRHGDKIRYIDSIYRNNM